MGRPPARTRVTRRCLPSGVSGALAWVIGAGLFLLDGCLDTTHRAVQGPVPSSPLGDYKDMTHNIYGADGATIATEGAKEAAEKFVDWVDSGYIPQGASSVSDSDALANFANGESLFLVSGNWNVSELSETMGDDVGFFMLPGQTPDSEPVASGSSVSFSISSKTEHANAAAAFLDYMRSPEAAQIQVD